MYDVSPATNAVYGCMDELAENYDPDATNSNNTTCVYLEGCKLPDAINYDPLAVIDDGSCVFQSVGIEDATYQLGAWMVRPPIMTLKPPWTMALVNTKAVA